MSYLGKLCEKEILGYSPFIFFSLLYGMVREAVRGVYLYISSGERLYFELAMRIGFTFNAILVLDSISENIKRIIVLHNDRLLIGLDASAINLEVLDHG